MTQRKEFRNSKTFSSPSPVVHPEVSVQWTRDGRGEVLISLKVPRDIVDAELFVKTTKGHFGILMDPCDKYQKPHVLVAKLFIIYTRTCSGSYAISWLECRQTNMFDAKTVILY